MSDLEEMKLESKDEQTEKVQDVKDVMDVQAEPTDSEQIWAAIEKLNSTVNLILEKMQTRNF